MKKVILSLAAFALVLASCSNDELTGVNTQNPDAIQFNATTTRASVADLSTLTGDAGGFRVYGTSGATPSGWYETIDGSVNYAFANNKWGWASGDVPQWPTDAAGYPMTFYAMYPADAPTVATAPATITSDVTIKATRGTQIDMLGAVATTAGKPADGALSMTFIHILSKVNFGVIAGNGFTAIVQKVSVENVESKGTYNYVTQAWAAPGTGATASYDYYDGPSPISFTGTSTETAVPFYTAANHGNHLMLVPQEDQDAWVPSKGTAASDAYAGMIYRGTTTGDPNSIGWTVATDYQAKYPGQTITGWGAAPNPVYTGIGTGNGEYNGALFIKVGFPLGSGTFTWENSKGYTYNIMLGTLNSSNGYYVSDFYYDEHGQETGIPVKNSGGGEVDPGEPVASGDINFKVDVDPWGETPKPLQ